MTRSQPNSSLANFDPDIERTLLHTRQARRRLDYTPSTSAYLEENTESLDVTESDLESATSYSSVGTTDTSLHPTGEPHMAEPRRITLHEQGAPDIVLQPLQARYPNLDPNFELKSSLINLLPKYHGLPGEDSIQHLKDFYVACSTARRHGADEVAIMVFAFPFSLEAQAKTWLYSLPDDIVTNWDFLRREFLDKFFPPEKTEYIRKEILGIMQRDQESMYEYWSRFKRLLESCPHHLMTTRLLISYFTGGLCAEDRRLLIASSGGSLSKNKMEGEAWDLIKDVAESTQHKRVRSNSLKGVVEPPPSEASLTKALGDMTTILTQIQRDQREYCSIKAIQAPPPVAQLEGPARICGLCSSTTHYTDQCHQIQEEHALVVANVNYNNRPTIPSSRSKQLPSR